MTVLLDTANEADALACGYNTATPYDFGGLKVDFEAHPILGPSFRLYGGEGEVEVTGEAEVKELIKALTRGLALNARAASEMDDHPSI